MKTATMKTPSMRTTAMKSPARVAGFTAEGVFVKLSVPEGMDAALQGLTREVLRHQPGDIYAFAAQYFESLVRSRGRARGRPGGGRVEEFTTVTHVEETTESTRTVGSSVASLAATTGTVAVLATASASQASAPPWEGGKQVAKQVAKAGSETSSSGSEKVSKKRRSKKDKQAGAEDGAKHQHGREAKYRELTKQANTIAHDIAHDTVVKTEEISKQLDDKSRAAAIAGGVEGAAVKQRTRRLKRQTKSVDSGSLSDKSESGSRRLEDGARGQRGAEEAKQGLAQAAGNARDEATELEQLHSWANAADAPVESSGGHGHGAPETSFSHYESSFVATSETAGDNAADFKAEELRVQAEGSVRKSSVHDVVEETTADGGHRTTEEKAEETMEEKLQASERTILERKSNVQVDENGDVLEEEITITRTEHSSTHETTVSKSWTMETTIETLADGETRVVERMIMHSPPAAAEDVQTTATTEEQHTVVNEGGEVFETGGNATDHNVGLAGVEGRHEFGLVEGKDAQVAVGHIATALEVAGKALASEQVVDTAFIEHKVDGGDVSVSRKEFGLIGPEEARKSMQQISESFLQAEQSLSLAAGEAEAHVGARVVEAREFPLIEPEEARKSLEQISAALVMADDSVDKLHTENAPVVEHVDIVEKGAACEVDENAEVRSRTGVESQHDQVDENAEVRSRTDVESQHDEVDENAEVRSRTDVESQRDEVDENAEVQSRTDVESKHDQVDENAEVRSRTDVESQRDEVDENAEVQSRTDVESKHDQVDENAEVRSRTDVESQHDEVDEDGRVHSHESVQVKHAADEDKILSHVKDEVRHKEVIEDVKLNSSENNETQHVEHLHEEVDEDGKVHSHKTNEAQYEVDVRQAHGETEDNSRSLEIQSEVAEERTARDVSIVDHATVVTNTSIVETLHENLEGTELDELSKDKEESETKAASTAGTDEDPATPLATPLVTPRDGSVDTPEDSSKSISAGSEEQGGLMNPLTVVISRTADVAELKDGEANIMTQMEKEGLVEGLVEGEAVERIITKGALQTLSQEASPQRLSPKVAGITVMAASLAGLLAAERGDDSVEHEGLAELEGGDVEALAELDDDTVEILAGGHDSSQFIQEETKHTALLLQEPSFEESPAAAVDIQGVHGDRVAEHAAVEAQSSAASTASLARTASDSGLSVAAETSETAVTVHHAVLQQTGPNVQPNVQPSGSSTDPELDDDGKPIPVDEDGKPMYTARKKRSLEERRNVALANDIIPDGSKVKLSRAGSIVSGSVSGEQEHWYASNMSAVGSTLIKPALAMSRDPSVASLQPCDEPECIAVDVRDAKNAAGIATPVGSIKEGFDVMHEMSVMTSRVGQSILTLGSKDAAAQVAAETSRPPRSDSQDSFIISEDAVYIPLNPPGAKQPSLERIDSVASLGDSVRNDSDHVAAVSAAAAAVAASATTAAMVEHSADPGSPRTYTVTEPKSIDERVSENLQDDDVLIVEYPADPHEKVTNWDNVVVTSPADLKANEVEALVEARHRELMEPQSHMSMDDSLQEVPSLQDEAVLHDDSESELLDSMPEEDGDRKWTEDVAKAASKAKSMVKGIFSRGNSLRQDSEEALAAGSAGILSDAATKAKTEVHSAAAREKRAVDKAVDEAVDATLQGGKAVAHGVAALGAGALSAAKDTAVAAAEETAETLNSVKESVKSEAAAVADEVGRGVGSVKADVTEAASDLLRDVEGVAGSAGEAVQAAASDAVAGVNDASRAVGEGVEKAVGAAGAKLSALGDDVHTAVSEIKHGAAATAAEVSDKVAQSASDAEAALKSAMSSAEAKANSLVSSAAETASDAKEALKSAADSAEASAKSLIDSAAKTASEAKSKIKSAARSVEEGATSLVDSAAEAASDAKAALKSTAKSAEESAKSLVDSAAETASDAAGALKTAAHSAEEGAKSLVDSAAETASDAKEALKSAAHSAEEGAKSLVDSAAETASDAKEALKSAADSAEASAKSLIGSAAQTASEAKSNIKSAAQSVEEGAKSLVDSAAETASDAKAALKSTAKSAEESAKSLVDSAAETASDAKEALKSTAKSAEEGAKSLVDSAAETATDAKEALKSAKDNATEELASSITSVKEGVASLSHKISDEVVAVRESVDKTSQDIVHSMVESKESLKETIDEGVAHVTSEAESVEKYVTESINTVSEELKSMKSSIVKETSHVLDAVTHKTNEAVSTTKRAAEDMTEAVTTEVDEAVSRTKRAAEGLTEAVTTEVDEAVSRTKRAAEGLTEAVTTEVDEAVSRTKRAAEDLTEAAVTKADEAAGASLSSASSALHSAEALYRQVDTEAEHAVRAAVETAHREEDKLRHGLDTARQELAAASRSLVQAAEDEAVTALAEAAVLQDLAETAVVSETAAAAPAELRHHADDTLEALEQTDASVRNALKHAEETISAEARKSDSEVVVEGAVQAGAEAGTESGTVAALDRADESVRTALKHAEETITAETHKTQFSFATEEAKTAEKVGVNETLEQADESVRKALQHAEETITAQVHEAHSTVEKKVETSETARQKSETVATLDSMDESVRNALTHAEETISAEARRSETFLAEHSETVTHKTESSQVFHSSTTESTIADETVTALEQAETSVKQALSQAEETISSEAASKALHIASSSAMTSSNAAEETVESHSETSESMERVVSTATATASVAHKMAGGIHERVRKEVSELRDDAPQSSPRDRSLEGVSEGASRRGRTVSDITSRRAPSKSDSWESNLRKSTVASSGKMARNASVSGSVPAAAKKGQYTPRNAKKAATQPVEPAATKAGTLVTDSKRSRPPLRKARSLAEDSSEDSRARVKKMPSQGSTKRTAISVESVVEAAGETVVERALEKARASQESTDEGSSETSTTTSTTASTAASTAASTVASTTASTSTSSKQRRHSSEEVRSVASTELAHAAATIQEAFRGISENKVPVDENGKEVASSSLRGGLHIEPVLEEIAEEVGLERQGGSRRGSRQDSQNADNEDTSTSESSLSSAATRIQAGFRGHLARRHRLAGRHGTAGTASTMSMSMSRDSEAGVVRAMSLLEDSEVQRHQLDTLDLLPEADENGPAKYVAEVHRAQAARGDMDPGHKGLEWARSLDSGLSSGPERHTPVRTAMSVQQRAKLRDRDLDEHVWRTLEQEMLAAGHATDDSEGGHGHAGDARRLSTRRALHRGNAMQMPTTSSSTPGSLEEAAATAAATRHTGEFHDMLVLPLPPSPGPPSQAALRPASGASRAGFSLNGSTATSTDAAPRAAAAAQQEAEPPTRAPSAPSAATPPPASPPPDLQPALPSDTSMKTAEVAATKIQAGFRGYKVRRQLREQSLDQSKDGGSGKEAGGQSLQSLQGAAPGEPGQQCRGNPHHPMTALEGGLEAMEAGLDEDLLQRSAARIQAGVRGFLVRRRQHNAAVAAAKIQAGFRGYRTRRELKQRSGFRAANKHAVKTSMTAGR